MQQSFTKYFMRRNRGCYDNAQLSGCSFMQMNGETVTLASIINSEIPLKDKFWFLCKKVATKEQNQQIAITVAEFVLPIYESRYPDSKAPREAIEAAKLFLSGHITLETLKLKRSVAYAAADAAYAAAVAAADAAYAAAVAAVAAADAAAVAAADAAAVAAYDAAAAAYDAAGIEKKLRRYLSSFIS